MIYLTEINKSLILHFLMATYFIIKRIKAFGLIDRVSADSSKYRTEKRERSSSLAFVVTKNLLHLY